MAKKTAAKAAAVKKERKPKMTKDQRATKLSSGLTADQVKTAKQWVADPASHNLVRYAYLLLPTPKPGARVGLKKKDQVMYEWLLKSVSQQKADEFKDETLATYGK